jgi:hypothetical protein
VAFQAGELADKVRCFETDVASLPAPVREWIQNSTIRGDASRIKVCTQEQAPKSSGAAEQEPFKAEFDDLKKTISDLSQSGAHASADVDQWLAQCTLEKTQKQDLGGGLHADYANPFELRSKAGPLSLTFSSGPPALLLADHPQPWMSIVGYSPNVTLNNAEIAALAPTAAFFDETLRLYKDKKMVFTPFPDTPRLPVKGEHDDDFKQKATNAKLNPKDYELKYVRYYLTGTVSTSGQNAAQVLMAYAYVRKGSEHLQISFSPLPLNDERARTRV